MDIGEVSKSTGLPTSTIRYYEEIGLIESVGRKGIRRQFSNKVLERLAIVSLGCRVGFTLGEIKKIFTPNGPKINREQLNKKADELDAKIKDMIAMRDGLRHAAACKERSHFECQKFLRILKIAGKKQYRHFNKLK